MNYSKVLFTVVSPLNAGLMIILNLLELFFIWSMDLTKKSKSTVFLINLSIADIFLGVIIFSAKAIDSQEFPMDDVMSDVSGFLKGSLIQVTLIVSILTNLVLTSERLLLVKSPIKYKIITRRHRIYACLLMWIMVMLVVFGFYFTSYTFVKQFVIISTMVFVSLPWPVICFVVIKRTLRRGLSKKYNHYPTTTTNSNGKSKDNINKQNNSNEMKFLSVCYRTFVVFVFCWLPYSIFGYLVFYRVIHSDNSINIQYSVHILAFLNSTLNPLIYLFTYGFISKFFKIKRKSRDTQKEPASSVTASTITMEEHKTQDM